MQVVTANRLADGLVIFLSDHDAWSEDLSEACIAADKAAAEALLAAAERAVNAQTVVGPYLIDITDNAGSLAPVQLRERIRAAGPTIRPDLGKQAE